MFVAMGVAVDHAFDAFGFGVRPEAPVHVEAIGMGVQFDPGAGLGAGIDHGALVYFVRFAFKQKSAGQMAEHVDITILRDTNDALRHLGLVLRGPLMDAGNHHIKLSEEVVVEVEFALDEDVHFRTGQEPEVDAVVRQALIECADLFDLLSETFWGESIRDN